MITIGIDPGWSSFGIAINKDDTLFTRAGFIPKNYGSIAGFISTLNQWILRHKGDEHEILVYIERFVTYGGTQSDPENILMLIGALEYFFSINYSKPIMVRALDWKVKICHHLVKTKNLSNPYSSFNKKYSIWAAENLCGKKVESDHEADAVCLSYLTGKILNGDKSK